MNTTYNLHGVPYIDILMGTAVFSGIFLWIDIAIRSIAWAFGYG